MDEESVKPSARVTHLNRLHRLARELYEEGVELVEDPAARGVVSEDDEPVADSQAQLLEKILREEVLYARQTPVHEGRRPAYGAIVFGGSDLPAVDDAQLRLHDVLGSGDHAGLREAANGITTFVVRTTEGPSTLGYVRASSEAELMRLAMGQKCDIVQRHPSGTVRVFGRERLLVFENDEWSFKPYAHTRRLAVQETAGIRDHSEVIFELLDVCLHVLSARHVGATFVLALDGGVSGLGGLSRAARPVPLDLNVVDHDHADALANLLASLDGACLVERDGRVAGVEAMFKATDMANDLISVEGGSRHNSAARYSFDHTDALVIAVSADGPVTVFSDGRSILYLNPIGSWAEEIHEIAPYKDGQVAERLIEIACPRCGKLIGVTVVMVDGGWNKASSCACPVCGHGDLFAAHCYTLATKVVKPWFGRPK